MRQTGNAADTASRSLPKYRRSWLGRLIVSARSCSGRGCGCGSVGDGMRLTQKGHSITFRFGSASLIAATPFGVIFDPVITIF